MSYFKKSAATFLTQVLLTMVSMATGILVARTLGPELKGQAALLGNLTDILFMCGSLGLGSAFSYFIAKDEYSARYIISYALFSSLILGLIVNLFFYLSWPLHFQIWSDVSPSLIVISTTLSAGYLYANYLIRIVVGQGRIYSMNIVNASKTISNFMFVLLFVVVCGYGLKGVVFGLCMAVTLQVIVLLYFLRSDIRSCFFGIKSYLVGF